MARVYGPIILLLLSTAYVQATRPCQAPPIQDYDLAKAVETPASKIDPALPSQCLAEWIPAALGSNSIAWSWESCDPHSQTSQKDRTTDNCVGADAELESKIRVRLLIRTGKPESKPVLPMAEITGCGRRENFGSLHELPEALARVRKNCQTSK